MVRDPVANVVYQLGERGFAPRKLGHDSWESRCPAHRGSDYSLSITRNEFNHVVLECRSSENCQHIRIVRALGWTNEHVYAETADWLISRLRGVEIQPACFESSDATPKSEVASSAAEHGVSLQDSATSPTHPTALPVVETATNRSDCPAEWEVAVVSPRVCAETSAEADEMWESGGDGMLGASPSPTTSASEASGRPGALSFTDEQIAEFHKELMSVSSPRDETIYADERETPIQILTSVAWDAEVFRSSDGRLFAQVPVGERLEIYGLRSAAFRDWLIRGYLADLPEPPSSALIRRAIGMLEAQARFDADIPDVFIRTGRDGDGEGSTYFIDLGDPGGRAIGISDRGWLAVDQPEVHFRRPEGFLPLPMPSRDGSIDLLRPYVNLTEADFRLMVTWLTAVLRPVGPYPILVLNGEQAAAKSTLVKVLRLLIDPHTCIALNLPTSTRNLMATAVNGWLLAYDNISDIPRWLSDALCQLVFGGAISGRALFTNDDRSFIYAQRPVLLSGIGDFVRWPDLKDRCVFLHLPPIPRTRRRAEDEFWRAFQTDRPRILGAVFDAIVGGLRELPSVHLAELPRMADYAMWGEGVGRGLGWGPETFLSTYTDNRKEATMTDLVNSPLGNVLLQVADKLRELAGTPAQLHAKLTEIVGKKVAASADWPKTAENFGRELRRLAPQLRLHGIGVSFERRPEGRIVTVQSEHVPNLHASNDS